MLALFVVIATATVPPSAPSVEKKCFVEYQAEHYEIAASVCEIAAKICDAQASADTTPVATDLDRLIGATMWMEAAWSNYANNPS